METKYIYKQTERGQYPLWTVGYIDRDGDFNPESDHSSKDEAADRTHWLNGGNLTTKSADTLKS